MPLTEHRQVFLVPDGQAIARIFRYYVRKYRDDAIKIPMVPDQLK